MYYVYLLRCADGSFYVGSTRDVEKRVELHNAGRGPAFTSNRRPVTLVFVEPHPTKVAAIRRERQLKGWTRKKKEALLEGDFDSLRRLSKKRRRSGGQ